MGQRLSCHWYEITFRQPGRERAGWSDGKVPGAEVFFSNLRLPDECLAVTQVD